MNKAILNTPLGRLRTYAVPAFFGLMCAAVLGVGLHQVRGYMEEQVFSERQTQLETMIQQIRINLSLCKGLPSVGNDIVIITLKSAA